MGDIGKLEGAEGQVGDRIHNHLRYNHPLSASASAPAATPLKSILGHPLTCGFLHFLHSPVVHNDLVRHPVIQSSAVVTAPVFFYQLPPGLRQCL